MSLDPQIAALLHRLNEMGLPDVDTITAQDFRDQANQRRLPRDIIESVGEIIDREVPGPNGSIPVRVYRPANAGPDLPLLVYFHGGGFVLGDLDGYDGVCSAYCNTLQAVVVSVGYRLAPEHPFPAGVGDAYAATGWASKQARALGASPAKLIVGGDSAGGNLAAVVCQQALAESGPVIAHQLLLYPVCDNDLERPSYQENATGYLLETRMMAWFWQQYLPDPTQASARSCPLRAFDLSGLPPATVVTCGYDPLRDEGEQYASRLADAGVPVTHIALPGAIHGFISFTGLIELPGQVIRQTAQLIHKTLHP